MTELLGKLHNSQKVKLLLSLNNIIEKYPDQDTESLTKQALRHLLEDASSSISEDEILQGLTKKIFLNKNINTFTKRKLNQSNLVKRKTKCGRRNKELSAQEKRALHIRRQRPEKVSYSDAITLWQHWCSYIEHMEWHQDRDGFNAQLNRTDMNGVLLSIVRAKNPSHVGMKGGVVV
ncbi:hypothetical protein WDU94_012918, partial [Cyamophila willieti]